MAGSQYCIFDLDGTVDSLPGIASSIDSAFADCGLRTPACNVGQLIGPPIRQNGGASLLVLSVLLNIYSGTGADGWAL